MTRQTIVTLALALTSPLIAPRAAQIPPVNVTCTFVNPAYAGSCVATTTRKKDQKPAAACKPILDCLNNPLCVKTYCQASSVRQGWTLKTAK